MTHTDTNTNLDTFKSVVIRKGHLSLKIVWKS